MANKKAKILDVDFVGGQGPLRKEEATQLSNFIAKQKLRGKKKKSRNKRLSEGSKC